MPKVMTKTEFAKRWDSDPNGGGITNDEVADCAKAWGLFSAPKSHPVALVVYRVVQASGARDQLPKP